MTTLDEARDNAARARAALEANLNGLEDKLNVPKRVANAYRRNPLMVIGVGIGVAAAIAGVIAWRVVRD
ncbi:hypothetical protein GCM10009840_07150 [Pseudolysinimonas kribbensis]|uniref:DUF3618 domain-containing protein n=1 Tax=Pseudolysinimonas kribbensis TaxID=433641 RepID=A0ABQ6K416_9MICO|nr:hypothetical protein [Pseudolysinimonas kribbensis]GMA95084.1 hypothetical protein GCM10025881_19080 [Pseudolysinimonas kribbensis]